ncbi:unnamed protein product [Eruca vesicaria subsp. sativa]|uniref:F-box domain-containing protein n=1 Tax=Eruca vesicaria subsp. sativa TaxID=29727 RepID=A0ABC8L201_ERUVS|nr:unnamed protein product [Eruca vesicaria subsp. sativa]
MTGDRKIKEAVDRISNLPDEILQQHILCYIPTKVSISTSILSRRWRHVWCNIPSISLDVDTLTAASVNETLNRYTALKTKSFHLKTTRRKNIPHVDRWISSVKQINIKLSYSHTIVPLECTVSLTSLQKLSLSCCTLFDESLAKILSGCPVLENLTLYHCGELKVLDLTKSKRLRTLQIRRHVSVPGPTHIVAPHIHCLRLLNSQLSCTFVDVASLTEAKLDICYVPMFFNLKADFLQVMVLKMLEKLQNAETLSFGENFILILSLAEIRGVPFPMFKVKALTLDTKISQYVIPGMERLLQNSPELEKLTVRARNFNTLLEKHLDKYLELQGFNLNTCWRSKDGDSWNKCCVYAKSKHLASLVELVLNNTKKLNKMVVQLDENYLKFKIEDVVPRLRRNKNVNVVLSTTKLMALEKW